MDLTQHADTIADLANAADDALGSAHDDYVTRLEELRARKDERTLTDDELTELQNDIVPNLQTVRGERQARDQRRTEAYDGLDSAFAELDGSGEDTADDTVDDDATGDTPEDVEATEQTEAPQPVAASADKSDKGKTPARAKPRVPDIGTTGAHADNNGPKGIHPKVAITAAGDHARRSSGATMAFNEVGEAMSDKLRALRSTGGNGDLSPVVTLRASGVPDNRTLRRGDLGGNTNKLDAVTSRTALTAAGGLCAPLAIDYNYEAIGTQARPIRDSLPGFQADRGGIQFRPDVSPVTNTDDEDGPRAASGEWTNEDDENAYDETGAPVKALWRVNCPPTETAEVSALTLQTEWSNVTSRFDPETVEANSRAALIWHDRFAENWLLKKLQAKSKAMTSAQVLGAVCDVLVTLDRVQAYYRSVHRLGANVALRAIMPFWVTHLIRADLARRMTLDPMAALNISDAQITSILQTRGLNPVWHLDGADADQAAVAYDGGPPEVSAVPGIEAQQYTLAAPSAQGLTVPNFPAQVDMLLHAEGHFTHLDGGTLDLGVVRDSALISQNRYRQFTETWEGVAARGVEALRVVASVWPTGETSGATSTTSLADK